LRTDRFYVYLLFRPWNGEPCYVGKGQGERVHWHSSIGGAHYNKRLANILKKAVGPLPFEIIHTTDDEEEAFFFEILLIAHFGRADLGLGPLCNRTDGGEGVSNPGPGTLQKLKNRVVGEWADPEGREKKMTGLLAALERPEVIVAKSRSQVNSWKDPVIREKRVSGLKKAFSKEELIEPIRQRSLGNTYGTKNKGQTKTPEACHNISAGKIKKNEELRAAGLPLPGSGPRPGARKPWSAARRAAHPKVYKRRTKAEIEAAKQTSMSGDRPQLGRGEVGQP
jgi:hypothetical protein